MDLIDLVLSRRSIRLYNSKQLKCSDVRKILKTAIWAPSGKNCQPWKFKVICDDKVISNIGSLLIHSKWIKTAPCLIFVFLDKQRSYDYIKDVQSCGALMQNILLISSSMNIGSCWVGEILSYKEKIKEELKIDNYENIEMMGMITLGYKDENVKLKVGRRALELFMI